MASAAEEGQGENACGLPSGPKSRVPERAGPADLDSRPGLGEGGRGRRSSRDQLVEIDSTEELASYAPPRLRRPVRAAV